MFLSFLKTYLESILSEFKGYRKRKKGIWYHVRNEQYTTGFASSIPFWTQKTPLWEQEIIDTENYN